MNAEFWELIEEAREGQRKIAASLREMGYGDGRVELFAALGREQDDRIKAEAELFALKLRVWNVLRLLGELRDGDCGCVDKDCLICEVKRAITEPTEPKEDQS